ncbi:MAG: hypothetical protein NVSMB26_02590 [Beijerinckiaceae bacterium]
MSGRIAIPRWAYLPGAGPKPDQKPLDMAKALVPPRFDAFVPADHGAFRYGLVLHDGRFFWEAHEVLEAVWLAAPMNGHDRIALRALIQIANAGLKQRMERSRAATRLIAEANTLIGELLARGPNAERHSVAGRMRAHALQDQLRDWSPAASLSLTAAYDDHE